MVRRQSAGEISSTPPVGPATPALFTSTSRPPSFARTSPNMRATSASEETSALLRPASGQALAKSARKSSETSQICARAP